jgi:hypothetical protein
MAEEKTTAAEILAEADRALDQVLDDNLCCEIQLGPLEALTIATYLKLGLRHPQTKDTAAAAAIAEKVVKKIRRWFELVGLPEVARIIDLQLISRHFPG